MYHFPLPRPRPQMYHFKAHLSLLESQSVGTAERERSSQKWYIWKAGAEGWPLKWYIYGAGAIGGP